MDCGFIRIISSYKFEILKMMLEKCQLASAFENLKM